MKDRDTQQNLPKGEYLDPVCGMRVHEDKAAGTSHYEGEKYYFCSASCKQNFEAQSAQYAVSVVPKSM
jgi:YHS domain-containing protein